MKKIWCAGQIIGLAIISYMAVLTIMVTIELLTVPKDISLYIEPFITPVYALFFIVMMALWVAAIWIVYGSVKRTFFKKKNETV